MDLSNARITSAGLAPLKPLARLEYLSLRGTLVTDDGLKRLPPGRVGAFSVDLSDTRITGKGLSDLTGRIIDTLHLAGTPFEDQYLADLLPLRISRCSLDRTPVTDEGLALFANAAIRAGRTTTASSPYSTALSFRKTRVTDEGVSALRKAVSNLWIER